MSAKVACHISVSGRPRVWMLLLATLAYVALTFHASIALASMIHSVPTVAYSARGDAAAALHTQEPAPLAPCCGEQQCATLVTAGPLVSTVHEPIAKFCYKAHAVTLQFRAPIPVLVPGATVWAQNRRLFQQAAVYLSTARLRL